MSLDAWLLFCGIWFVAGLPLGPNALNCMSVAAERGFARALLAVSGILLAAVLYIAAVSVGLSALIVANEPLFRALKIAGALYLIWLGIGLLRGRGGAKGAAGPVEAGPVATVRRAVLISLSNPKAMIAYGAVFSQFIVPAEGVLEQLGALAPTALVINAVIYTGYSIVGLGLGAILATPARWRWFNRGVGGFYVAAGAALAAAEVSTARRADP